MVTGSLIQRASQCNRAEIFLRFLGVKFIGISVLLFVVFSVNKEGLRSNRRWITNLSIVFFDEPIPLF